LRATGQTTAKMQQTIERIKKGGGTVLERNPRLKMRACWKELEVIEVKKNEQRIGLQKKQNVRQSTREGGADEQGISGDSGH